MKLGFPGHTTESPIEGKLSSGETYYTTIHVLSAFTLLLMKLHAFRDRCHDDEKDLARIMPWISTE
jgi:predicted nucleotidyltransferase